MGQISETNEEIDGCAVYYYSVVDTSPDANIDWPYFKGLINDEGQILIKAIYDEFEVLGGNRFRVRQGSTWGIINIDENWLVKVGIVEVVEKEENGDDGWD
jgi:hypothetical protein